TATFGINVDPKDASHVRLHQLKTAGTTLQWAVGWSEDPGTPPTVEQDSDGEYVFVTPESRSWILFEGFMNSFPFSFALNAVVESTVGIQVSGEPELIPAGSERTTAAVWGCFLAVQIPAPPPLTVRTNEHF